MTKLLTCDYCGERKVPPGRGQGLAHGLCDACQDQHQKPTGMWWKHSDELQVEPPAVHQDRN